MAGSRERSPELDQKGRIGENGAYNLLPGTSWDQFREQASKDAAKLNKPSSETKGADDGKVRRARRGRTKRPERYNFVKPFVPNS